MHKCINPVAAVVAALRDGLYQSVKGRARSDRAAQGSWFYGVSGIKAPSLSRSVKMKKHNPTKEMKHLAADQQLHTQSPE
jgi:hypothetical protein